RPALGGGAVLPVVGGEVEADLDVLGVIDAHAAAGHGTEHGDAVLDRELEALVTDLDEPCAGAARPLRRATVVAGGLVGHLGLLVRLGWGRIAVVATARADEGQRDERRDGPT